MVGMVETSAVLGVVPAVADKFEGIGRGSSRNNSGPYGGGSDRREYRGPYGATTPQRSNRGGGGGRLIL